jgi:glycosyltransferase involved in cell wall biosynthesis
MSPFARMAKVIGCYVVWNEAQLIVDSIRSLKAYVDGFVFVDSAFTSNPVAGAHSTDETRLVAEAACDPLPVTYIESQVKMRIPAARNLALLACEDDWAFIVDGDETLLAHRTEVIDLFASIRLGDVTEPIGVSVYTANLLFHGHAPQVSQEEYDSLPLIYSRGVQPRLLPARGTEWRRVPNGETYGIYRDDALVKVPADPRLTLINHHTAQPLAGYRHDYVWESVERQG